MNNGSKENRTFNIKGNNYDDKDIPFLLDSFCLIYFYMIASKRDLLHLEGSYQFSDFTNFIIDHRKNFDSSCRFFQKDSYIGNAALDYIEKFDMHLNNKELIKNQKKEFMCNFFRFFKYRLSGSFFKTVKIVLSEFLFIAIIVFLGLLIFNTYTETSLFLVGALIGVFGYGCYFSNILMKKNNFFNKDDNNLDKYEKENEEKSWKDFKYLKLDEKDCCEILNDLMKVITCKCEKALRQEQNYNTELQNVPVPSYKELFENIVKNTELSNEFRNSLKILKDNDLLQVFPFLDDKSSCKFGIKITMEMNAFWNFLINMDVDVENDNKEQIYFVIDNFYDNKGKLIALNKESVDKSRYNMLDFGKDELVTSLQRRYPALLKYLP